MWQIPQCFEKGRGCARHQAPIVSRVVSQQCCRSGSSAPIPAAEVQIHETVALQQLRPAAWPVGLNPLSTSPLARHTTNLCFNSQLVTLRSSMTLLLRGQKSWRILKRSGSVGNSLMVPVACGAGGRVPETHAEIGLQNAARCSHASKKAAACHYENVKSQSLQQEASCFVWMCQNLPRVRSYPMSSYMQIICSQPATELEKPTADQAGWHNQASETAA